MDDLLPLFPLGTVLFPGVVLPLHVFEERYRVLVRELLDSSGPRRFGVVAIRKGAEVAGVGAEDADDEPVETYAVGCVAEMRRVQPYADGRFDLVTTGGPRFRLRSLDSSRPYLQGRVDYLRETTGDPAPGLVARVQQHFTDYWQLVAATRDEEVPVPELPDDPGLLSYLVASALVTDLPEKQELLTIDDAAARLRRESWLLRRECALIERWSSSPDPMMAEGPFSLS